MSQLLLTSLVLTNLCLMAGLVVIWRELRTDRRRPTRFSASREDRIAQARGAIDAAKGVELTLGDHAEELPAAMILANARTNAAYARHELRSLGVEP